MKQTLFKPLVEADETISKHLSRQEIDQAFDLDHHTRNVETIFRRVGLGDN